MRRGVLAYMKTACELAVGREQLPGRLGKSTVGSQGECRDGYAVLPLSKVSRKATVDLDGDEIVYRDGAGLEQRLADYQFLLRVTHVDRHRELGIVPQLGTLDTKEVQDLLLTFMYREGMKKVGSADTSGWRSVKWCENVISSEMWARAASFQAFLRGAWQEWKPAVLDVRAFRPEGLFAVGGERVATAEFRLKMVSSLVGVENTPRGIGGEEFKGITVELRDEVGDSGGQSRGITESMLWWKVNCALGQWCSLLRRASAGEVRRSYPTLQLCEDGSSRVKGPRVAAALLRLMLAEISLQDCLPMSEEAAGFMARCWPKITFGPGASEPAKSGTAAKTVPTVKVVTPGTTGKPTGQICLAALKHFVGMETQQGGAAPPCSYRGCARWHVKDGITTRKEVTDALKGTHFDLSKPEGKKLGDLVYAKIKK